MKKKLVAFIVVAGVLGIITSCQKADNTSNQNNEEDAPDLEGLWDGAIKIPDQPLHIIVSLQEGDTLSGSISIPVQGIDEHPLSTVESDDGSIMFTMEIGGQALTFDGEPADDKIKGTFTQAGQSFPFELDKEEETMEDDADGEFLTVDTEEGTLYGELETPEGKGPHPVMIIIPGSGPTDRNGNTVMGDNNSLKMMAKTLAEDGIASLRYDKRGSGKNKDAIIHEEDMRFDQFIADASHWVDLLSADEQFNQVGITGHSQGSLVGMIAAQDEQVDVFVSIAGAGGPIDQVMVHQLEEQLPESLLTESKDILQKLKEGEQVDDVSQALQSEFRPSVQPFLSSWMQYNPVEEIQQLDIPTLIVNGTRDLQVPEDEADKLLEAKGDADKLIVDKMNHVLKEAPEDKGGNLETYWDPELPLAEGLMDDISRFLDEAGFGK